MANVHAIVVNTSIGSIKVNQVGESLQPVSDLNRLTLKNTQFTNLGFTGSQGVDGVIGVDGYTGSVGFTGSIGYTGSQGIQGTTGFAGSTGFVGSTGFTGSIGFTGSQGSQGTTGFTGSTGFAGSLLVTDNTTSPTGTWEKSTDGTTWGSYNSTDRGNDTTYIRYTPASIADNVVARPLLTLN